MKYSFKPLVFYILIFCSFSIGCKDNGKYESIQTKRAFKNNKATHKVIAKEFKNAANYTYVKVEENDNVYWVAVPEMEIEIGKTYFYQGAMKMENFRSNELDTIFKEIWFANDLFNKEHKVLSTNKVKSEIEEKFDVIEQPANGTSVEYVLKNSQSLSNNEVVIKGKVVKVNRNILSRNWVHLKDGTSHNSKSEITITTSDTVNVGDIVTFNGKVTLNKDFGYGYVYPILIENGSLLK